MKCFSWLSFPNRDVQLKTVFIEISSGVTKHVIFARTEKNHCGILYDANQKNLVKTINLTQIK